MSGLGVFSRPILEVTSRSVVLSVASCHVRLGCFLTVYLEGNFLVVRRDVREKNRSTLCASHVTHDT